MKTDNQIAFIRNYKTIVFCIILLNLFFSLSLNAATINVSSIAALQNACNNSNSGDIIILANGTYQNVANITTETENGEVKKEEVSEEPYVTGSWKEEGEDS